MTSLALYTNWRGKFTLHPAFDKLVDAEFGAEIGGGVEAFRVERDASRVGDPVDRVEEAGDRSGVDQAGGADTVPQPGARLSQPLVIAANHRFGKFD
jgi:hypothetical protein